MNVSSLKYGLCTYVYGTFVHSIPFDHITFDHIIRYLFILLDSDKTAVDDLMATLDSELCSICSVSIIVRCGCVVLYVGVENLVLAVTSPDVAMVTKL